MGSLVRVELNYPVNKLLLLGESYKNAKGNKRGENDLSIFLYYVLKKIVIIYACSLCRYCVIQSQQM